MASSPVPSAGGTSPTPTPTPGPSTFTNTTTNTIAPTPSGMTATTLVNDPSTSSTLPPLPTTSNTTTTTTTTSNAHTEKKKTKLPKIIPPAPTSKDGKNPRGRTLVLCFDGTGDQFDADNSNIIQFFSLLQKYDPTSQRVYYQSGIGTYTVPQVAPTTTPLVAEVAKSVDAAVAWNLDAHVMDGYAFLMQEYQANDKICIFGFSRGAYTARSLAGMLHKVGLLPAGNHQQVPFAYKMYTRTDEVGWEQSVAFKKAFSIDVKIEFVGVWDTVNSVGLITPRRLPFVSSNTAIRYFRHAVSLDERRAKFKANLWNRPTRWESGLGVGEGEMDSPRVSFGEGEGEGEGGEGGGAGGDEGGKEGGEEDGGRDDEGGEEGGEGSEGGGKGKEGLGGEILAGFKHIGEWAPVEGLPVPSPSSFSSAFGGGGAGGSGGVSGSGGRMGGGLRRRFGGGGKGKGEGESRSNKKGGNSKKESGKTKKKATVESDSDENDVRHEVLYSDDDFDCDYEDDGDECLKKRNESGGECACEDGDDDEGGEGKKEKEREEKKKKTVPETDVLEVWFAGCHCDVGGGSVKNNTRHNLARIPLRWMIRECFKANTGIRFHTSLLKQVGLDPETLYPVVKDRPSALYVDERGGESGGVRVGVSVREERTGDIETVIPQRGEETVDGPGPTSPSSITPLVPPPPSSRNLPTNPADVRAYLDRLASAPHGSLTEEEEDLADALCPVYDQLEIAKGWWVLEVVPLVQRYQEPGVEGWTNRVMINRGRGRDIPEPFLPEEFRVHRTVDVRMKATGYVQDRKGGVNTGKPYVPKARYKATPFWVD